MNTIELIKRLEGKFYTSKCYRTTQNTIEMVGKITQGNSIDFYGGLKDFLNYAIGKNSYSISLVSVWPRNYGEEFGYRVCVELH